MSRVIIAFRMALALAVFTVVGVVVFAPLYVLRRDLGGWLKDYREGIASLAIAAMKGEM